MKKILLTSICRPIGERYGDAPSVGYELLFGQVTRAQGLFSPRANHSNFGLEYIAENLNTPCVVLQYPNRREFIRELRRGYDVIGISFILATFHRMKEMVALIRKYSPSSKIVLGGYGTVLSDEVLKPFGDSICREEGVGFMRRLMGEPEDKKPYRHPLIVSRLRLFGNHISETGMIFAGLGCPNGCDFCSTSHFFKRRHIRLLETGQDIYDVISRYQEISPGMSHVILDEDFLLNKRRAMEFRDSVQKGGRPLSIFAFASVRAISQYTVQEILEMGIDGFWVGFEGRRSGYAKQAGKSVTELVHEFHEHGITILSSMIVGFPYQDPEIIKEEFALLMKLKPDLAQFLIYGPILGTPFYDKVMSEGLLHRDLKDDREYYYRNCTGFKAMVAHGSMSAGEIEAIQRNCYKEDFRKLGPSIYRITETWLKGYQTLKGSPVPFLRKKGELLASEIRKTYPIFLSGKLLGPTEGARRFVSQLEREVHETFGPPTWAERFQSVVALGCALWTGFTLKFNLFQHPSLTRHAYRMENERGPSRIWRLLQRENSEGNRVEVELRPGTIVWVRVEGKLALDRARLLAQGLLKGLRRKREQLVLDFTCLVQSEGEVLKNLAESLQNYRDRIRIILPAGGDLIPLAILL